MKHSNMSHSDTVLISDNGNFYHDDPCCYVNSLYKGLVDVSLGYARYHGYMPCEDCFGSGRKRDEFDIYTVEESDVVEAMYDYLSDVIGGGEIKKWPSLASNGKVGQSNKGAFGCNPDIAIGNGYGVAVECKGSNRSSIIKGIGQCEFYEHLGYDSILAVGVRWDRLRNVSVDNNWRLFEVDYSNSRVRSI